MTIKETIFFLIIWLGIERKYVIIRPRKEIEEMNLILFLFGFYRDEGRQLFVSIWHVLAPLSLFFEQLRCSFWSLFFEQWKHCHLSWGWLLYLCSSSKPFLPFLYLFHILIVHKTICYSGEWDCYLLFWATQMNYETLLYQHTITKVLYLQLWGGLFLVLQDSWCLGLLDVWDEMV